jgi:hypothetical protein
MADAPRRHLLRHAVGAAQGDTPSRPCRAGKALVHCAAADAPQAQCRVRRVLSAVQDRGEETRLPEVQALQPIPSGAVRRGRRREVDVGWRWAPGPASTAAGGTASGHQTQPGSSSPASAAPSTVPGLGGLTVCQSAALKVAVDTSQAGRRGGPAGPGLRGSVGPAARRRRRAYLAADRPGRQLPGVGLPADDRELAAGVPAG